MPTRDYLRESGPAKVPPRASTRLPPPTPTPAPPRSTPFSAEHSPSPHGSFQWRVNQGWPPRTWQGRPGQEAIPIGLCTARAADPRRAASVGQQTCRGRSGGRKILELDISRFRCSKYGLYDIMANKICQVLGSICRNAGKCVQRQKLDCEFLFTFPEKCISLLRYFSTQFCSYYSLWSLSTNFYSFRFFFKKILFQYFRDKKFYRHDKSHI